MVDSHSPPDSRLSTPDSTIFLLTGMPGSGKSSVARGLVRRYARGVHVPVDDVREWVVAGIAHPVPIWTEETSRQFTLARRVAAFTVRTYADAGFAVAIDDVISPDEAHTAFIAPLAGHDVFKVLLRPRLEVALARSAGRTTKAFDAHLLDTTIRDLYGAMDPAAFAAAGWQVLDTSDLSVEETVTAILESTARRS